MLLISFCPHLGVVHINILNHRPDEHPYCEFNFLLNYLLKFSKVCRNTSLEFTSLSISITLQMLTPSRSVPQTCRIITSLKLCRNSSADKACYCYLQHLYFQNYVFIGSFSSISTAILSLDIIIYTLRILN